MCNIVVLITKKHAFQLVIHGLYKPVYLRHKKYIFTQNIPYFLYEIYLFIPIIIVTNE